MGETDTGDDDAVRLRQLLGERAEREWARGEAIQVVAAVGHVDQGRHRVRGLDHDGLPSSATDRVLDSLTDVNHPGVFTVVRGDHPRCAAVGLYEAAGYEHTWLTVTPLRVAILRLRDAQNRSEGVADAVLGQARRGEGEGLLRGVGKILKASAAELVSSRRRPPLADRPHDAVLECPVELPRHVLQSVEPWKPRMLPTFDGGPRYVQVHLADGSWACFATDAAGAAVLTRGPGGPGGGSPPPPVG